MKGTNNLPLFTFGSNPGGVWVRLSHWSNKMWVNIIGIDTPLVCQDGHKLDIEEDLVQPVWDAARKAGVVRVRRAGNTDRNLTRAYIREVMTVMAEVAAGELQ